MTIAFDETIQAVWFLAGHQMDWMAGMNAQPDGTFLMQYRFRYYDGDQTKDSFHDGDRKSWYKGVVRTSREEAIDGMQAGMTAMIDAGFVPPGGCISELIREKGESQESFYNKFKALPYVHCQPVSKEEGEKIAQEAGLKSPHG